MPYVPSEKTDGKSQDRNIIDAAIEPLASKIASKVTENKHLKKEYKKAFVKIAELVDKALGGEYVGQTHEAALAFAIYKAAEPYGYWGAHLGEFNYAITRLIQRVPQVKVANGEWEKKNELRYWLYIETVKALVQASRQTEKLGYSASEVFVDIKDEYKWKVNRSYEMAQIVKSGDCYDTPFYSRGVEMVDEESGKHVGYTDSLLARSEETLHKDLLDYVIPLRKKKST